jgi:hypothetical protein
MPSAPLPPEKDAEVKRLAQAIREVIDSEIDELERKGARNRN